jgi:hypothetical protein
MKFEIQDDSGQGLLASMKFEVAGVSRSVVSVGSLVSKGFDVSFDKEGGWISKGTRRVPLVKRGNRYFLRAKWRQARGQHLELAPLEAPPQNNAAEQADMDRMFEDFDQDQEEADAEELEQALQEPEGVDVELLGRPEQPGPVAVAPKTPSMPSKDEVRAHK